MDDGERGRRRKRQLRLSGGAAAVAVLAMVAAATLGSGDDEARPTAVTITSSDRTSTTTTDAPPTEATADTTTTTTPAPPRVVTTARPVRPPPPTTTTAPPHPEVDGLTGGYWIVRLDGSGLRRISTDGLLMTWSPTGDRLALATPNWIWKLPTDASQPAATVASGSDLFPRCMDWASTGDLAWVTDRGDLFVAADGALESRIVRAGLTDVRGCRWSPDGRALAVVRYSSVSIVDRNGSILWDWPVFAGPPDGGYPTTWFAWSPDSRRLAVSASSDPRSSRYGLFVAPADGPAPDGPVFPPHEWRDVTHVSWDRRDGDLLHVQAGSDSSAQKFVVDVVDRSVQPATVTGTRVDALTGGRFLTFRPLPDLGNRKQLVLVEADGSDRRLAFGKAPSTPNSLRECRGIYFIDKRVAPNESWVAIRAGGGYGPRCDSPSF